MTSTEQNKRDIQTIGGGSSWRGTKTLAETSKERFMIGSLVPKKNRKLRGRGQLLGQLGSGPCFLVENQVRNVLLKKNKNEHACDMFPD
jgi:hypothetical protein